MQVGNMNYLAGRRCSAWKTAVSMERMDEERQERDETDSSSQPSSIHPSTPPTPLSPSRPHPLSAPFLKSLSFFLSEGRYKEICHRFSKNRILRLTCLMGQRGKFELKHTSWSKTTAQIKVFNAGFLCFFAYECHQLLFSQRLVSF